MRQNTMFTGMNGV